MTKMMLIDAIEREETRVVITDNGDIEHFDFVSKSKRQIKGNIYLAKITRIEPSLQAAFVEYGGDKQGFLPFAEVHPDYYQIPVEDREKLLREAEAEAAALAEEEAEEGEGRASEEDETEAHRRGNDDPREDRRNRRSGYLRRNSRRRRLRKQGEDDNNYDQDGQIIASEELELGQEEPTVFATISDTSETEATVFQENEERNEEGVEVLSSEAESNIPANDEEDNLSPGKRGRSRRRSRGKKDSVEQSEPSLRAEENNTSRQEETLEEGSVPVSMEDEEEDMRKRRPLPITRRYKIQEVLRPGQIVLVQVIKEERGNKGVSLSTYISLAGRYCVLMPNSPKGGGISRKIGSGDDRKRLKEIAEELKDIRGMSAIIRTAGIDRTRTEIKRDYEYLIKLWNQIRDDALASIAPSLVYEESDVVKRSIRDHYNGDIDTIYVQGDTAYRQAKEFMKLLMPSHAPRVKQFKEAEPIFTHFHIEALLTELYKPVAPLKSGGYIVINPTEALIAIDVNSGKSTTERNVEETAYKTNLEACAEIARQLRLRNLGGLIVIDFIDMSYHKYRRHIERALKEAMRDDRAKVQVGHISMFGLLELSRQRMGASLEESTTQPCQHCQGTGKVALPESTVMQLMRNLQSFISEHGEGMITLQLSQPLMLELINRHRHLLDALQAAQIHIHFDLHDRDDQNFYSFKGKNGLKFSSDEGFSRKQGNQRQNQNQRSNRQQQQGKKQQHTPTALVAFKESHVAVGEEEQQKPIHSANDNLSEEQDMDGEKSSPRRSRNRRNRRRKDGASREIQSEVVILEDNNSYSPNDEEISISRNQKDKKSIQDNIFTSEAELHPSTSHVAVEAQRKEKNEIAIASKMLEDTPPPSSKKKGWWQRVMEG